MWHSSDQPFIFFLFELVHLNDLHYLSFRAGPPQWPQWRRRVTSLTFDLGHISNLNGNVKEALKSSIFVVQKAAAPKTGVEFRQGSNGTITSSLATSYDVWRRRAMSQAYSTAVWWVYSLAMLCDAWWRHQTNWELRNFEVGEFRPIREDRVYHSWSPCIPFLIPNFDQSEA